MMRSICDLIGRVFYLTQNSERSQIWARFREAGQSPPVEITLTFTVSI